MPTPPHDVGRGSPNDGGVQLDPELQARLLERMREEQQANARRATIVNRVIAPLAILAVVIGIVFSFSDDLTVAVIANTVASLIGYVLYRVNRPRIRALLGLS